MATQTKTEEYIANQALMAVGASPIRGFNLISTISKASAGVVVCASDQNFQAGDTVYFWGVGGMIELNGTTATVNSVSGGTDAVTIDTVTTAFDTHTGATGFIVQNSEEGRVVAQHFVNVRDSMLGDHRWNFLVMRATLSNSNVDTDSSTHAAWTASVATLTVPTGHGFVVGDQIKVSGITPSGYNGNFTVTVSTSTTIAYALAITDPGTGTVAGTVKLAPLWGYGNTLELPDDFVELIIVDDSVEDHAIENVGGVRNAIVSDDASIDIGYVFRGRNATLWPYKFVDAVAARLAAEICVKLTGSLTKAQMLYTIAQRKLDDAIYHDSKQGGQIVMRPTEWTTARQNETEFLTRGNDVVSQTL